MDTTIGDRIRPLLRQAGINQGQLADDVGMTRDAMSRAMNGQRGFSSIEVALIAERLNQDVHWLITGRPDPNLMAQAARCSFDFDTGTYANAGEDGDQATLDAIRLAYAQGWPAGAPQSKTIPQDASEARRALGDHFVSDLSDRVEATFDVDVIRTSEVSTDYALTIGERCVLVIEAKTNWFRENWSIAHELGHFSHGHRHESDTDRAATEPAANAFAADLLLPADEIRGIDWQTIGAEALGMLLWDWGVSTDALRRRLSALRQPTSTTVDNWLAMSTIVFLKQVALPSSMWGKLTERQRAAATRRFPTDLLLRHEEGVTTGRLAKNTLAWMLAVSPEQIAVPEPTNSGGVDLDDLAAELGLMPR